MEPRTHAADPAPEASGPRTPRRPLPPWGTRTLVMGIVNCTPDSFSGDGVDRDVQAAVALGAAHAAAGADILDLGGESSRPGAQPVSVDEEAARVLPAVAALLAATDLPISVDTCKAEVAVAALEAGATIINDVWGLRRDPALARAVVRRGATLILMHNRRARPRVDALGGMYPRADYADLLGEVRAELNEAVAWARQAGVPARQIWCDPGLGFGKTPVQSLELLRRLPELDLGQPLLVGPSRKSFVGRVLGLPVSDRVEGTAAAVAVAVAGGADVVRVHDVGVMVRVARMADAIVRGWAP